MHVYREYVRVFYVESLNIVFKHQSKRIRMFSDLIAYTGTFTSQNGDSVQLSALSTFLSSRIVKNIQ